MKSINEEKVKRNIPMNVDFVASWYLNTVPKLEFEQTRHETIVLTPDLSFNTESSVVALLNSRSSSKTSLILKLRLKG